ncbi:MAG: hypothetical protein AAF677_16345 [Pseudomonadota bacterium]
MRGSAWRCPAAVPGEEARAEEAARVKVLEREIRALRQGARV